MTPERSSGPLASLGLLPDGGCTRSKTGLAIVGADLSAEGADNIFLVGDTASSDALNRESHPWPGASRKARQATYAANVIAARLSGKRASRPFKYKHGGSLATIGRSAQVTDFGWIKLSGAPA